jgi:hypothetical protein
VGDSALRGKYHDREPLAFRTSRKRRFYVCGPHVVRSYQKSTFFASRDFLSRPLTNIQRSMRALREAGTLPRSPRIKWGAGTLDAPIQVPSGTESMRMNAALGRARLCQLIKTLGDTLA